MDVFFSSFMTCLDPLNLLLMALCAVVGVIFGAIPGLSGGMGMTLILPLTFGMAMYNGFSMLLGMYVGGISGSFIAAVLVGIPGSASSIATCYDGYPMSQKGQTSKALALGIICSFMGTFFSVIIAMLLSGPIADLALKLGPWELFSLCFCAVVLVASLSRGNAVKGMIAAGIGLLAACIGMDPITASLRFTFNSVYFQGGIDMVAAMLGIFALLQVSADFAKGNQKLPEVKAKDLKGLGVTLRDFTSNIKTILLSFVLGVWIGFLPGMGSSLANMVAYAQCKSSSKNPDDWGTGIPEGVMASEVSNNAAIGGALIPMMSLGIPGDAPTALLLSGLIVHGLQPGPLLISTHPDFVYFVFVMVLLAAIFVCVGELLTKRWFPFLLKVPYHYLYSAILVMCYVGAYTSTSSMFNVFMMVVFLFIGVLFQMADIPSSPMILAFILAENLESYFRKGFSYTDQGVLPFFTRPVSLAFLLLAAFSVFWPMISEKRKAKKAKMHS